MTDFLLLLSAGLPAKGHLITAIKHRDGNKFDFTVQYLQQTSPCPQREVRESKCYVALNRSVGSCSTDRLTYPVLSTFVFGPMAPIVDGGLAERWEAGGSAGTFQGDVVTAGGFKHSFLCMFAAAAAAAAAAAVTVAAVLSGALSNLHYHNVQCLIRGTCAILHGGILCTTLTYLKICALSRYVALCTYFSRRVGGFQVETCRLGTPAETHRD